MTRDGEPDEEPLSERAKDLIWGCVPFREGETPLNPVRLMLGLISGCRACRLICPRRDAWTRLRATLEMCRS